MHCKCCQAGHGFVPVLRRVQESEVRDLPDLSSQLVGQWHWQGWSQVLPAQPTCFPGASMALPPRWCSQESLQGWGGSAVGSEVWQRWAQSLGELRDQFSLGITCRKWAGAGARPLQGTTLSGTMRQRGWSCHGPLVWETLSSDYGGLASFVGHPSSWEGRLS